MPRSLVKELIIPLLQWYDGWMGGWMTCNFTSFSIMFQSYQSDGRMIIKGCVQGTPFTVEKISPGAQGTSFTVGKISPRAGLEPENARLVGQRLTL